MSNNAILTSPSILLGSPSRRVQLSERRTRWCPATREIRKLLSYPFVPSVSIDFCEGRDIKCGYFVKDFINSLTQEGATENEWP